MNANAEFRNDELLTIWRDLISEPVWKYKESFAILLSQRTKLDLLEASDSVLWRAMWFWLRRPGRMFHGSTAPMVVALCLLICLSTRLVNWHVTSVPQRAAELIIILFEVAVEVDTIGYRLKFLRWPREHERSVDRILFGAFIRDMNRVRSWGGRISSSQNMARKSGEKW